MPLKHNWEVVDWQSIKRRRVRFGNYDDVCLFVQQLPVDRNPHGDTTWSVLFHGRELASGVVASKQDPISTAQEECEQALPEAMTALKTLCEQVLALCK